MSTVREFNPQGQMRLDVAHLRLIESGVAGDFDILAGIALAGKKPLIIKGFVINTSGVVGQPATALQMTVADSICFHYYASENGSIFRVPADRAVETLSSTNSRIDGSFTASSTNYIGLDLYRSEDLDTVDEAKFLDSDLDTEYSKNVPLARTLDYRIVISTIDFSFSSNVLPIAKVSTDADNKVTSITDCRWLFFRLGSGGAAPDVNNAYPWPDGRTETAGTTVGGDKAITSFKDWCDAVMTRLWDVAGGEKWYSATNDRNLQLVRSGAVFASNGEYFEWVAGHLHWRGLTLVFDNSTGFYNDIANQTVDSAGLTDLADGECIYVDVDRTQNLTGASALVAAKAPLVSLGSPAIPGSRVVLAMRYGANIWTRDGGFPVGNSTVSVATTISPGVVKISSGPLAPGDPVALEVGERGAASGVAALDAGQSVEGTGLGRGSIGAGALLVGTGVNDTLLYLGRAGRMSVQLGYWFAMKNAAADEEIYRMYDSAGVPKKRFGIDWLGYPFGQYVEERENWWLSPMLFGGAVTGSKYTYTIAGGSTVAVSNPGTIAGMDYRTLRLSYDGANNATVYGPYAFIFNADMTASFTFDLNASLVGAVGQFYVGFGSSGAALARLNVNLGASLNYRLYTRTAAGASTDTDTGLAVAPGTTKPWKLEILGANTSYGACVRLWYQNGSGWTLVATNAANIPTGSTLRIEAAVIGGAAGSIELGPLQLTFNKVAHC